jgi:transcription termination factor Rho
MSENQTDLDSHIDFDNLYQKKLPELKEIAKSMGLKGVSTLRKQPLIDRIREASDGRSHSSLIQQSF